MRGRNPNSRNGFKKGIVHSKENIEAVRLSHLGKPAWNSGKTGVYSEDTLKRMSLGLKGRPAWNKGKTRFKYKGQRQLEFKLKKYGINESEYNNLLKKQNSVCAICLKEEFGKITKLSIDHDHETGKVRGLLCRRCNTGIGMFMDNPYLLEKAVKYLLEYNPNKNA